LANKDACATTAQWRRHKGTVGGQENLDAMSRACHDGS
jgi:hypothetical protein